MEDYHQKLQSTGERRQLETGMDELILRKLGSMDPQHLRRSSEV
jgi:hypothetical protein